MAALDAKLTEFMNSAKFDEMNAADKQKFMSQFTYEMGNNIKQMMMDRESDDTIRNEAGFFSMNAEARATITEQIAKKQGERTEQRMPNLQGTAGAKCYPLSRFDDDGKYQEKRGGMDMKTMMKDQMGDMQK